MTYFKDTLAKLISALCFQENGTFPSQPQQNPKEKYNVNASSSRSQHMDQVKSDITLRSGKEGVEYEHCKEKVDSLPALSFPHAMTKQEAIEDEKGTENIVTDHLSKLTIDSTSDITPIDDYFLDESLLSLNSMPWFAKNSNFLALGFLPVQLDNQDKREFLSNVQNLYWDDPYSNIVLIKYFKDAFPTMR